MIHMRRYHPVASGKDDHEGGGAWEGAEKTMSDAPATPASPAYDGTERTMTDAPAARPSAAYDGTERTMTDAPAAPAAGPWNGTERTMTDAPAQGDRARQDGGSPVATEPGTGSFGAEPTLVDAPVSDRRSEQALAEAAGHPPTSAIARRPADRVLERIIHPQDAGRATPTPTPRPGTDSRGATDYRPGTDTGTPSPSARVRAAKASRRKTETETWHLQGRQGPLTGQVFGDYELGGVLGEGGMGTIYRAWQYSLKRRVAVKTLSSAFAQDAVQRARFEMEARTASLIKSPHVVQVYGAGSYNDIAYFVMEFVEGVELGHLIAQHVNSKQPFAPDDAAGYVLQAAKGLAEAATQNVVHRDIKPANMLIDQANTLKIADFGISKITGENNLTRTGTAIGTPSYVSPEQGRGEAVDARSDLYSLGVVFYELLVLKKPFEGTTANALIYQHNYAEPRLPREIDPTIPEAYQAVVLKLLQKVPDKRYQSAAELVRDLENLRAGNLSLTALIQAKYGTGADEMMRKYLGKQRRWVVWTVAALLVIAIGSVAGLWYWMSLNSERQQVELQLTGKYRELSDQLDVTTKPIPLGAKDGIDAYAAIKGADTAAVERWRRKVTEVEGLRQALGRLNDAEDPAFEDRQDAERALNRLQELTGPGYASELTRWRERLGKVDEQIAGLHKRFKDAETRQQRPTLAFKKTEDPYLARLRRLAGDQDAVFLYWDKAFKATEERGKALEKDLERLAGAAEPTRAMADQFDEVMKEYVATTGLEPARTVEWKARITPVRMELNRLKQILSRLDERRDQLVDEALQGEADKALGRWVILAGADDALIPGWKARLDDSRQRTALMRERLKVLDDPQGSRPDRELVALQKVYDQFQPLARPDDARAVAWGQKLAREREVITGLTVTLARLETDRAAALTRKEALDCEAALQRAIALGALTPAQQVAYVSRLQKERAAIEALTARLNGVNAANVKLYAGLVEDAERFRDYVGADDPAFQAWSRRVMDWRRLYDGLKALDSRAPIPDRAREMLNTFAAETEAGNGDVQRWTAKLNRHDELMAALAPLNAAAPIPERAEADIEALVQLVGDLTQAKKWSAKIRQVRELTARLRERLDRACLLDPVCVEDHATLAGLIGESGSEMVWWKRHLRELAEPGRPAWAAADTAAVPGYGSDRHGWFAVLPAGDGTVRLRWVPAGRFIMGSPLDEPGRDSDESPVEVAITRGFWMAETETTQRTWQAVMGGNPSDWRGEDHPVERVSHADALAFCARLSQDGVQVRLPSEAEWEYACRAGSVKAFASFQGGLDAPYAAAVGWMRGSSDGHGRVAQRQPNRLGLFDLHGNVWEWCGDRYGMYSPTPVEDPRGTTAATWNIRGGSWGDKPERCRAANRQQADGGLRSAYLGFRMVIGDRPETAAP